jgi:hypothetical protein
MEVCTKKKQPVICDVGGGASVGLVSGRIPEQGPFITRKRAEGQQPFIGSLNFRKRKPWVANIGSLNYDFNLKSAVIPGLTIRSHNDFIAIL